MSSISPTAIALFSALSVAAVAGAFSVFNLLVTKDQKISEFRQSWIGELRADFALLVGHAHQIASIRAAPVQVKYDFRKETSQLFVEINQAGTRVRLRLNRRKPLHIAVLEDIKLVEKTVNEPDPPPDLLEKLNILTTKLEYDASTLIKAEWERVKQGEPVYRVGKWLTATVFVLASIALAWEAIHSHPSEMPSPTPPPARSSPSPQTPSPSSR
jgi:hypothetical protein